MSDLPALGWLQHIGTKNAFTSFWCLCVTTHRKFISIFSVKNEKVNVAVFLSF